MELRRYALYKKDWNGLNIVILFIINLSWFTVQVTKCTTVEEDLSLTKEELDQLQNFRTRMLPFVDKEYKKEGTYLIRWLRARQLNVDKAQEMLLRDIEWRKEEQMDNGMGMGDQWTRHLPFTHLGYDYQGKPVLTCNFEDMDFRKAVLSGKGEVLTKAFILMMEWGERLVRAEQLKGNNVTRFHFIGNLRGFNAQQHTCPGCMTIYLKAARVWEAHYPNLLDNYIAINSPSLYRNVINFILPLLSDETRRKIRVFGRKQEWEPILHEFLPEHILRNFTVYEE